MAKVREVMRGLMGSSMEPKWHQIRDGVRIRLLTDQERVERAASQTFSEPTPNMSTEEFLEETRRREAKRKEGVTEFMQRIGFGGYHVYRMFAEDGTLLYIGASSNVKARIKNHYLSRSWVGEQVVGLTISEPYSTQAECYAAEREAIMAENPVHNKVGRGSRVAKREAKNGQSEVSKLRD